MPQKRKPPRLWLRPAGADGSAATWVILDAGRQHRTGCAAAETDRAAEALAAHIAGKYQPSRDSAAERVTVADALLVYLEDRVDTLARPAEARAALARLNDFFGAMPLAALKAAPCRRFAAYRGTQSGARRDLEVLRSAIRHYQREHGLSVVPQLTLPQRGVPRQRHLTRAEAAQLLRAAWRLSQAFGGQATRRHTARHIARLILLGLYTGTRPGALLALRWMPSTTGGWIDVEAGVLHRRAEGERVASNKRKPPARIPPSLLAHLRRWRAKAAPGDHVIQFAGKPVKKIHRAFRAVVRAAGLGADVTPHVLRHTRGTWLAQAGVAPARAADALGMTIDEYERTYLHHDPAWQHEAANAY